MSFLSKLFGGAKSIPPTTVSDAELKEAIRREPEMPDAYYQMAASPTVSAYESRDYYEKAVEHDRQKSKAYFSYHWDFALKAASVQLRGPCIDAFTRALMVDSDRFASLRRSIDSSNRFALAAWDEAKEIIDAYNAPALNDQLWKRTNAPTVPTLVRSHTQGDLGRIYQECHARIGSKADSMMIKSVLPDGAFVYGTVMLRFELEQNADRAAMMGLSQEQADRLELTNTPLTAVGESRYIGKEMSIMKIEINWEKNEVVCYYGEPIE